MKETQQVYGKLKIKKIKTASYNEVSNNPVIPTELKLKDINELQCAGIDEPGWYAVRIHKGIEVILPHTTCHKDFETCLRVCNVHNSFIGLSDREVTALYSQRRFNHI